MKQRPIVLFSRSLFFWVLSYMRAISRCDARDTDMLPFMCPRCIRETDGIVAKLVRYGIASEALRRNWPLSNRQVQHKVQALQLNYVLGSQVSACWMQYLNSNTKLQCLCGVGLSVGLFLLGWMSSVQRGCAGEPKSMAGHKGLKTP